tara:strand:- start:440 stop:544 length:105 start_codon:yes stop_codon:yes gene_type:complete
LKPQSIEQCKKKTFGKAIAANNGINNLRIKKEGF